MTDPLSSDSFETDVDGDGQEDTVYVDQYEDGAGVQVDLDSDGEIDATLEGYDTDSDGEIDHVDMDVDGDGATDYEADDANGDGVFSDNEVSVSDGHAILDDTNASDNDIYGAN